MSMAFLMTVKPSCSGVRVASIVKLACSAQTRIYYDNATLRELTAERNAKKYMPTVAAFYSINERNEPEGSQFYHNNSDCPTALNISQNELRSGTNGYRLCAECDVRNVESKQP
jgi:hypothetical protein